MQILNTLRDFLKEEDLKFLPGNLQVGSFMLLRQNKKDKQDDGSTKFHQVLQVFDEGGAWIGEITDPQFIPTKH